MTIDLIVGIPICDLIKQTEVRLEIQEDQIAIKEIVEILFNCFEGLRYKLEEINFINNSRLRAIYVIDNRIVQEDHTLTSSTKIRILPPICGG